MNTPSLLLSLELFDSEKARKDENNAETFVICNDNSYTRRGNLSLPLAGLDAQPEVVFTGGNVKC